MKTRKITGECLECESSYTIEFVEELVSQEFPEYCPFCGAPIDELSEESNDDDGDLDERNQEEGEWD